MPGPQACFRVRSTSNDLTYRVNLLYRVASSVLYLRANDLLRVTCDAPAGRRSF